MDLVFLIGRSLLGLVFILAGIQVHLVARKQSAEMARGVGVPFPEISVPLTGIIIVVAGLMVALGVWPDLAAILLILFLVSAASSTRSGASRILRSKAARPATS
jgi:putative oxidoreductase